METHQICGIAKSVSDRADFWAKFIQLSQLKTVVEVGVWKGEFAANILDRCKGIETYYLVDPWRHLDKWNKPANVSDELFNSVYSHAISVTERFRNKRVILRGKTNEVIEQVQNESIDLVYIDGDHTLRGIAIDLSRWAHKVRPGGFLGGDDFRPSIWQHGSNYEATMVFPFAVHFAEAWGYKIYGLPYNQFLMEVGREGRDMHEFVDLTGKYKRIELRQQCRQPVRSVLNWIARSATPEWVKDLWAGLAERTGLMMAAAQPSFSVRFAGAN
jgi:Methyltransferase domain